MSNILWLSDFTLLEAPGGAQRSDHILIKKGRELGHSITHITSSEFSNISNFNDFDTLITSNIQAILAQHEGVLEKINEHKKHIRVEHDLNEYLSQQDRIKLFSNCRKTIFLTEFHHKIFLSRYGDIFHNVAIVPDPIDTDVFRDFGQERSDSILYVGYQHEKKGTNNFFELALTHPEKEFVIAGWSSHRIYQFLANHVPNVKNLGVVTYEQMPTLCNKYKTLYYDPNLQEPLCRSCAEAICCGMKIFTTKQNDIGCIHDIYKFGFDEFKNRLKNASKMFWEEVA